VLRDKQLPIRGFVNDDFISKALDQIPDGKHYIIIEPCSYPNSLDYLADGNTHIGLVNDLKKLRGLEVWAGLDLNMPDEYWKENLAEDVLIARKPE